MQDEQDIVHRAQRGDKEALAQLYETHFDKVYRYVRLRIGNRTEAEDVTQQVFLKAVGFISTFKWKGIPFAAWLFRIAHNEVADHWRKESKQGTVPLNESLTRANSSAGNPHLVAEHQSDIEQLMTATKRLTKAQREVISLRFASELSIAQVASVMGKSQGAVKALQHSAIVALREALLVGEDNEER
ncbi:MAG: sigma-70 family RNA polymerase sigma factor [Dehalococcoidia bacterium]